MDKLTTPADINPNNFILFATNSSMSYSFRYDPRAADLWRFRATGVQLQTQSEAAATSDRK